MDNQSRGQINMIAILETRDQGTYKRPFTGFNPMVMRGWATSWAMGIMGDLLGQGYHNYSMNPRQCSRWKDNKKSVSAGMATLTLRAPTIEELAKYWVRNDPRFFHWCHRCEARTEFTQISPSDARPQCINCTGKEKHVTPQFVTGITTALP